MVHFKIFVLFFIWILHLRTEARTSRQGQSQVIGSSQPIVAMLGDDVILPCHVEPLCDVEKLTVTWQRPDIPPDPADPLSNYKYVHRYHDNHDVEDLQMLSYAGRTALVKGELKHGNVSLKLKNVTLSDQGWYRCHIPQLGSASIIRLIVEAKSVTTRTTETPTGLKPAQMTKEMDNQVQFSRSRLSLGVVVCFLLILFAGFCGYLFKRRCQSEHLLKYGTVPAQTPPV